MKLEWRQLFARKAGDRELLDVEEAPTEFPSYVQEYFAAFDRAESFGLRTPARVIVRKECVDMAKTMPVLLDYFDAYGEFLFGRTATIHTDLQQALLDATGVPFNLTIGWMELEGKPLMQHGDEQIARFLRDKRGAYEREGLPFHIWLTSPAMEILDLTFAMNVGWAKSREDCAHLVIYQPVGSARQDLVYHPMLVGDDFFVQTGAMAVLTDPTPTGMQ